MSYLSKILKSIDDSFSASMDSLDKLFSDFPSIEDLEDTLSTTPLFVKSSISKGKGLISETPSSVSIKVPYDRDKEKLSHSIKNGILSVTVNNLSSETESSMSTLAMTIPSNAKEDSVQMKYNKEDKTMEFSFKKKNAEKVIIPTVTLKDDVVPPTMEELKTVAKGLLSAGFSKKRAAHEMEVSLPFFEAFLMD